MSPSLALHCCLVQANLLQHFDHNSDIYQVSTLVRHSSDSNRSTKTQMQCEHSSQPFYCSTTFALTIPSGNIGFGPSVNCIHTLYTFDEVCRDGICTRKTSILSLKTKSWCKPPSVKCSCVYDLACFI